MFASKTPNVRAAALGGGVVRVVSVVVPSLPCILVPTV